MCDLNQINNRPISNHYETFGDDDDDGGNEDNEDDDHGHDEGNSGDCYRLTSTNMKDKNLRPSSRKRTIN